MSKIRDDFDGCVLVHHKGEAKFLTAGDTVPTGVKVDSGIVDKPAVKRKADDVSNTK